MNTANTVKPELLGGFQDYLPPRMIAWQRVVERIRQVYELFGFLPLDTPCMERWDVLTGGGTDFDKSVFSTKIVQGLEDRGQTLQEDDGSTLRFDLTVSLARVVAAYPTLPKPFKRYQIGKVWRGEKPQRGRFREFVQFDIDTIGSRSMLADTEIIQIMTAVMQALEIPDFLIKINDRKILNGLAEIIGCANKTSELCRILDKVDQLGIDGVINGLAEPETASVFEEKLVLSPEKAEVVRRFLSFEMETPEQLLEAVRGLFGRASEIGEQGVAELLEICRNLDGLGIPRSAWKIDLSVARGLGYYTGPVFETVLTKAKGLGSVFSGGRFDGLANRFMPKSNIPGVGASVGVDRLIAALEERKALSIRGTIADVLVTVFDKTLTSQSLAFADSLRQAGIKTELYIEDAPLGAQVGYAVKQEIPFVVIIGPDEVKGQVVTLKTIRSRVQEKLTVAECCARIRSDLAQ